MVASPSAFNTYSNTTASDAPASTRHASGTVAGLTAALPVTTPLNHCGGADLPLSHDPSGDATYYQANDASSSSVHRTGVRVEPSPE